MRTTLIIALTVSILFSGMLTPSAHAEHYYRDHFYIAPPPPNPKAAAKKLHDKRYPLPETTVRSWLTQPMPTYSVEGIIRNSDAMKQMIMEAPAHQVAVNRRVEVEAAALFDASIPHGDKHVFLAEVNSAGAYALRLRINLMGLRPDDTLWILDAEGSAAFGPYTTNTAKEKGQWLPPTIGNSVTLALSSPDDILPLLTLVDVAHFYKPILKQQTPLPCNIPIARESNAVVQEISTAVGRLLIPYATGQGLCTTTLLNSDQRVDGAPTPYLIGAWHCFGDGVNYDGLTVYWDYRSPNADGSSIPDLAALDWSMGAKLIDHSFPLDSALLKLNNQVPVGPYGRAWAGWDSEAPAKGDVVQNVHHPVGADLKTSRGIITNDSTDTCMNATCSQRYDKQIKILWNDGVTEQGSSGSALLIRSRNFRIAGVLSNGTTHSCTDSSGNLDNFGPFHAFFPQIGCYLLNNYTCQDPYEAESKGCFLFRKGFSLEMLQNLRIFRDETLNKSTVGKRLVMEYYTQAPVLEKWLDENRAASFMFNGLLTLGAAWGAGM